MRLNVASVEDSDNFLLDTDEFRCDRCNDVYHVREMITNYSEDELCIECMDKEH
jgi:hypothetical protein